MKKGNKNWSIVFVIATLVILSIAVCIYMKQLTQTTDASVVASMQELSRHDMQNIQSELENSWDTLSSVYTRTQNSQPVNIQEVCSRLNIEQISNIFNTIYLVDSNGNTYSSSNVIKNEKGKEYVSLLLSDEQNIVMRYDNLDVLETITESLVYGVHCEPFEVDGIQFIGIIGFSKINMIAERLKIDSFDGRGYTGIIDIDGNYVVNRDRSAGIGKIDNYFDQLQKRAGLSEKKISDIIARINKGEEFLMHFNYVDQGAQVVSFIPMPGTTWSIVLSVPQEVFREQTHQFMSMTTVMLMVVVIVLCLMMFAIIRISLISATARAEAKSREEFLSNMSHEIRTPLNGIIGLNHLMERHVDDATAMRDYVNRLGKAAQYLLSLVNDILDMSKLQAGKVDLTSEPFDVDALVDNVCEMQRGPMADRGIRFELSRTVEHPWLRGDEVRLSQVLMNILSNAVKFTPEGGRITMKVHEAVYASGNEAVLTVSIADTGCGMTKEFAEHVFDAFTQERNRNSDSQKGTGLGMSISYLLMTQMGGSITVESEPGCGSCFTVIVALPTVANGDEPTPAQAPSLISPSVESAEGVGGAERAEGAEGETAETVETVEAPGPPGAVRAVSSPSGAEAARAPVEILVAEDNELNADIISSILTEEGFSITVAENGEEAVRLFSESPVGHFAAILMDAQMPVMDGYEASRAIRDLKRADAKTVRIFACTASTFAEDRNRALASGMDDFLSKPLNVTVMLQKLEAVRKGGAS